MINDTRTKVIDKNAEDIWQGWRGYSLVGTKNYPHDKTEYRLEGSFNTEWVSTQLTAECKSYWGQSELDSERRADAELHLRTGDCLCGIYVRPTIADFTSPLDWSSDPSVLAQVVTWGWTIPAQRGWRAQHCRIEALWLVDYFISIGTTYGFYDEPMVKTVVPPTIAYSAMYEDKVQSIATSLRERYNVPVYLPSLGEQREMLARW